MLPNIEVIVGTYTDFLLGYQLVQKTVDGVDKIQLKATFADKSHAGSIKCVAVQGPWVASGGNDDRIFIYDMRTRKQSHILHSHTGTINDLVFSPDLTHLLSASADGHLMATRVGSWTTEGDWRKAHAGNPVTHVACHPSSRLALSLGGDQVLNTWNLVKGRVAYRTNLKSKRTLGSSPDCLSWATDGSHFMLSGPLHLEIWNIETASVVRSIETPSKPICVSWLNARNCLIGLETGSIAWISLDNPDETVSTLITAHDTRVKSMCYLDDTLVSISSAGEIKVWRPEIKDMMLNEISSMNIDCRPTCLGLLDLNQFANEPAPARRSTNSFYQQKSELRHQDEDDEDKGVDQEENNIEIDLLKPRSFVSIEYEQNAKPGKKNKQDSEEAKSKDKYDSNASDSNASDSNASNSNASESSKQIDDSEEPNKDSNPKKKAIISNDSQSDIEEDHDSDIESESESDEFGGSSSSENELPYKGGQKTNKRKGNIIHKLGAKHTKRK